MINVSVIKFMQLFFKIKFPQKSIFGFKILSSFHSSIFCYILLFFGRFLNPLFGLNKIQLAAGSLFNIILHTSILILITNAYNKRNQIKKNYFLLLNFLLFLFLPFSVLIIFRSIFILFPILF